jgi:hypothetical protein
VTVPNKRAGITISTRGTEAPWGYWPEHLDNVQNGYVGRAAMQLDRAEKIAAPLHDLRRAILEKRPNTVIPQPDVRTMNARRSLAELADVKRHLASIEADLTGWSTKTLKPYSYDLSETKAKDSFVGRQELRSVFRGMNASERHEALNDPAFRRAILEQPPQASGLRKSDHDILLRAELQEKFPAELQTIEHAREALDVVRVAVRATDLVLADELAELGQAPTDPTATEFAATFAA